MRAGRSVLSTCVAMFFPPRGRREPTGKAASCSPHSATTITVASSSYLTILMFSTPRSPATSLATAAETSDGDDSCATSVATRRSAACSSARRLASARASAFEIAVANSSVNCASRASVSSGNGSSRVEAANTPAHTRPSTTIGTPTADRIASCRASSTPRQLHRPEPHCASAVPQRPQLVVHGPPSADPKASVRGAPGGHERHRVVGLEAHQGCRIGAHEPADLLVDRREQLVLRHAARDERRDPPKRRLLLWPSSSRPGRTHDAPPSAA